MRNEPARFLPHLGAIPTRFRSGGLGACLVVGIALAGPGAAGELPAGAVPISQATGRKAPQPDKDYEQWREAKRGGTATLPAAIHAPQGFEVELLRSAQPDESSWISLAFDPRGRILISQEGTPQGEQRGILRITPPADGQTACRCESIDNTLQECRGLLYAFDSLYARCNKASPGRPAGLYRLRDTDGDDRYDEVRLLRAERGGGHGINDLALGPDQRLYLIQGDESGLPADWRAADSRVRHFGYDQLFDELGGHLPRSYDRPPPGYLVRTDADGQSWEVLCAGLRNPYGIDFNPDGEPFTYEADMESHIGFPFYRPTHLIHLVPGVDYGWRDGTRPWPLYYPERPPVNLTIGLGSPTAVKFGTHSRFPPRYRQALFVLDWAYGRILAVHLTPTGASYTCRQEDFLDGRPLNATDLEFGPDGALYFITGGRQTQSGLYRLRYVGQDSGDESVALTPPEQQAAARATEARALRRRLEALQLATDAGAVDTAWPHLASDDPWIRGAARLAVEAQDVALWKDRALAERQPTAALTALLALARCGAADLRPRLLARLGTFDWPSLDDEQRMTLLRSYELLLIRWGKPSPDEAAALANRLAPCYPAATTGLNRELAQLLVYLGAPGVVDQTVRLAAAAEEQSDQVFFLEVLRNLSDGWTPDTTRRYFETLAHARQLPGGNQYPQYVQAIETAALARLSAGERLQAARILERDAPLPGPPPPARPLVKAWAMSDLEPALDATEARDLARGKELFVAARCSQCHRCGTLGTLVGPDLTSVARRFSRKDLLRSIIEPSAVVDDKYRLTVVVTDDGRTLTGTPLEENEQTLVLSIDPLGTQMETVAKQDIAERKLSSVSSMPQGLADTLSAAEILDLLAWLEQAGQRP